ncbi:MAG: rod shape-determining protein, partial [Chloroflexi bacterium]|nr:rod shape-determining protein [Chloroflexota bacterium]
LNVTNDLAVGLRIPFHAAEEIKIIHGRMDVNTITDEEMLDVAAFGEEGHRPIARKLMAEIIHARIEEILQLILAEIKRTGYEKMLPAGVVLCGGTAELPGLRAIARDVFQMPVRIGMPSAMEGFVDRVSSPAFATAIGLLLWGFENGSVAENGITRSKRENPSPLAGVLGWAKRAFLPG